MILGGWVAWRDLALVGWFALLGSPCRQKRTISIINVALPLVGGDHRSRYCLSPSLILMRLKIINYFENQKVERKGT